MRRVLIVALLAFGSAGCADRVEVQGGPGGGGAGPVRPSCRSGAPGADRRCGASGDIDCCGYTGVPGGTYDRLNNPSLPATVSSFELDLLEVTMGRFRQFVQAYPGSLPEPGQGAHPGYPDSGWQAAWAAQMPADREALSQALQTSDVDHACLWDPEPAGREELPMECVTWLEAFAFCVWDGGRLPSFLEWNYTAAGGDEQRTNPWGEQPYDTSRAVYIDTPDGELAPAGSAPAGRARWGQYDLGGSRSEYVLDYAWPDPGVDHMPPTCEDCLQDEPLVGYLGARTVVDMGYANVEGSVVENDGGGTSPGTRSRVRGFRCIYAPPEQAAHQ